MKTNVIIALLLVSSIVIAQNTEEKFKISKNQWVLGGNFSFNNQNSESNIESSTSKTNSTAINIKPDIGYFISDNLIVGLMPGYSFSKFKNDNNYESEYHGISITPYIRKYFSLTERFAFHLQGEVMFTHQEEKNINNGNVINYPINADGEVFFVGFRPGITYSLTNKLYLNANFGRLGYTKNKWNRDNQISKNDSFNFSLSTSDLYFGILFVL